VRSSDDPSVVEPSDASPNLRGRLAYGDPFHSPADLNCPPQRLRPPIPLAGVFFCCVIDRCIAIGRHMWTATPVSARSRQSYRFPKAAAGRNAAAARAVPSLRGLSLYRPAGQAFAPRRWHLVPQQETRRRKTRRPLLFGDANCAFDGSNFLSAPKGGADDDEHSENFQSPREHTKYHHPLGKGFERGEITSRTDDISKAGTNIG
jgi:hypothetical protein